MIAAPLARKQAWDVWVVVAALAYFALRLVYYAARIDPYVPPDEVTHFGKALYFAQSLWLPGDSPESHELGLIAHTPSLYYFLLGKLSHLNVFGTSNLVFLRLVQAPLGMATVIFGYRWICLITRNKLSRVLFVVLLTNTSMFTFLSASISYDNLVNALSAMSLYYLSVFVVRRETRSLLAFLICIAAGALTKTAFLPLGFILLAILLVHERRSLPGLHRRSLAALRPPPWGVAASCLVLGALVVANVSLYGGNLLRYRKLEPSISQVLTIEHAMKNRIFARGYFVGQYRGGKIGAEEARRKIAEAIEHEGDRLGALVLLRAAVVRREKGDPSPPNRLVYAIGWCKLVAVTMFGIMGHISMHKPVWHIQLYLSLALLAVASSVPQWRSAWRERLPVIAAAAALFYVGVLMQLVNYEIYRGTGVMAAAVQGRYLFPVIVPLFGLATHFMMELLPRRIQIVVFSMIVAFVVYGDWPYFLRHAEAVWFR